MNQDNPSGEAKKTLPIFYYDHLLIQFLNELILPKLGQNATG